MTTCTCKTSVSFPAASNLCRQRTHLPKHKVTKAAIPLRSRERLLRGARCSRGKKVVQVSQPKSGPEPGAANSSDDPPSIFNNAKNGQSSWFFGAQETQQSTPPIPRRPRDEVQDNIDQIKSEMSALGAELTRQRQPRRKRLRTGRSDGQMRTPRSRMWFRR